MNGKKKYKQIGPWLAAISATSAMFLAPVAQAADPQSTLTIGAVAGLSGAHTNADEAQQTGINSSRKWGYGLGAFLGAPLGHSPLSLSVGAEYVRREFKIEGSGLTLEKTVPTIFVPVELKLWAGNMISVGAGGFGAAKVGSETDTVVAGSNASASFSSGQRKSLEYGLTASVDLTIPFSGRTGLVIEGRYLRGLSDSSKDPLYNEHIDDFTALAGLSFGF